MVKPHTITDIRYCGLKYRLVSRKFGPIIGKPLKIWICIQKHMGCNIKLCNRSSSYFNDSWASRGIHILEDLYDRNGFSSLLMLPVGVVSSWNCKLEGQGYHLDWDNIWINIPISSRNPAHQLIHYKFVYKFYITPYRHFTM